MSDTLDTIREEDGRLPAAAWPGGYPVLYLTGDGGTLCPECANGENGSDAFTGPADCPDDEQWRVTAHFVHYEGPPEICDHCGAETESAYGDPDAEPNEPEEGDLTLSPSGRLGSRTLLAVVGGPYIGQYSDEDEAIEAAHDYMTRERHWPNLWRIDDHGGAVVLPYTHRES